MSPPSRLAVLVAEDDPQIQSLIRLCLEAQNVRVASTSAEACDELRRGQFDLVITDLKLGEGSDGMAVVRCAAECQEHAFVVMMTGSPSAGAPSDEDLRAARVQARLPKPFLPREVRALVDAARRAQPAGGPSRLV